MSDLLGCFTLAREYHSRDAVPLLKDIDLSDYHVVLKITRESDKSYVMRRI
jgi:hypothetical protein